MSTEQEILKRCLAASAALLISATLAASQEKHLTAREIINRIQAHVGVPWQAETLDTFKAGNPDEPVTGVALTMMATMDVLERAAASGKNLVITHEPTFYNHLDKLDVLPEKEKDPVLAAKLAFIAEHHLVVWRFHDHWHMRTPDGIEAGMAHALGWEKQVDPENQYLFAVSETTLESLAAELKKKLDVHVLRIVGDPHLKIKKVGLVPGASGFQKETLALERNDVDVLVTGEPREWETVEYVADAATQGKHKGLIILSHIPSEQAGMEECAQWLKTFVNEVPVEFVPAKDPFWRY